MMINKVGKALTARQREALFYAALGFTLKSTAKVMNISHETVREHRAGAILRLGAQNIANAVYLGHDIIDAVASE